MTASLEDVAELKALKRRMVELNENMDEIRYEEAILDKELECARKLEEQEKKRNDHLKKLLQEAEDLTEAEKKTTERNKNLWRIIVTGKTFNGVLRFVNRQLEEQKEVLAERRACAAEKVNAEIQILAIDRPEILEVQRLQNENDRKKQMINDNAENMQVVRRERREESVLNFKLFKVAVLDVAPFILRYHRLVEQLKNPLTKVPRVNHLGMSLPTRILRLPSLVAPTGPTRSESSSEKMAGIPSTSKCHEKRDTNEAPEKAHTESGILSKKSFDRRSIVAKKSSKSSMQCTEDENTKSSKPAKASVLHPHNSTNKAAESEKAAARQFEGSIPMPQKPTKPKVTFVNLEAQGSGFEMDYSDDEGDSTRNLNVAATNDMQNDISPDNVNEISFDNENEDQFHSGVEMDLDMEENRYEGDFDDNISDWASLEPNQMNEAIVGSPAPSSTFGAGSDIFNNPNDDLQSNNDNYDFGFRLDDSDMDLFK